MKIRSKDFKKISIRGRVAYGICCFENAMQYYGISGEGWDLLLEKLWEFTSIPANSIPYEGGGVILALEKWVSVSSYLPNSQYYYDNFIYKDLINYINKFAVEKKPPTQEEYDVLKRAFNQYKNKIINELGKSIYNIGTDELWAGIDDKSQITLDDLQEVIDTMNENNIPLPDMEPFRKYDFHKPGWDYDLHGWGEMFDGQQYSKFLKPESAASGYLK